MYNGHMDRDNRERGRLNVRSGGGGVGKAGESKGGEMGTTVIEQ